MRKSLSANLTVSEKLAIIEAETDLRKKVASMCNLSQGIREDAGTETQAEIIMNMLKNGETYYYECLISKTD